MYHVLLLWQFCFNVIICICHIARSQSYGGWRRSRFLFGKVGWEYRCGIIYLLVDIRCIPYLVSFYLMGFGVLVLILLLSCSLSIQSQQQHNILRYIQETVYTHKRAIIRKNDQILGKCSTANLHKTIQGREDKFDWWVGNDWHGVVLFFSSNWCLVFFRDTIILNGSWKCLDYHLLRYQTRRGMHPSLKNPIIANEIKAMQPLWVPMFCQEWAQGDTQRIVDIALEENIRKRSIQVNDEMQKMSRTKSSITSFQLFLFNNRNNFHQRK